MESLRYWEILSCSNQMSKRFAANGWRAKGSCDHTFSHPVESSKVLLKGLAGQTVLDRSSRQGESELAKMGRYRIRDESTAQFSLDGDRALPLHPHWSALGRMSGCCFANTANQSSSLDGSSDDRSFGARAR